MDRQTVATELAEELRINTRLRHRLGMEEGTGSGVISSGAEDNDTSTLYFDTTDGQTFAVGIVEVSEVDGP